MGVFDEDRSIRASMLKKLWVSEGFLKPTSTGKRLETIAHEYLMELVDRNLIIVDKLGSIGNVKYCRIHDLLRGVCLKEVEKERFYHIIGKSPSVIDNEPRRRVVFQNAGSRVTSEVSGSLPHARSIILCDDRKDFETPHDFRLLRTFKAYDRDTSSLTYDYLLGEYYFNFTTASGLHFLGDVFELVNSRYLAVRLHRDTGFPSSINLLWNLNTLILHSQTSADQIWDTSRTRIFHGLGHGHVVPIEIWQMHQLRHLVFMRGALTLPDPPSEMVIMENLQTLRGAKNLYLNKRVVKRIPNVRKLHLVYDWEDMESLSELKQMERANCFSYFQCLSKLESLYCRINHDCDEYLQSISFPQSLKKLKLSLDDSYDLELVEILEKIGWLPLLQKLVLHRGTFKTGKWDTTESQFQSLKLLQLDECEGLKNWTMAESSHFPLLHELRLLRLTELEEIPSEVGEIATLKSIYLEHCSESAVESAKKIVEEQEDLQGDQLDLHVRVLVEENEKRMLSLRSPNFKVTVRAQLRSLLPSIQD
ncbi:late blight resistance protein R1-A-like [Salvia miltiorrhiza]|uniref:late blight resistance protein R1-A-like n=1 Tax=Salvia miltiorrhiza TaxID=226208 RepID=UPI0025ACB4CF|nr:late blight resistance protein R1-A-like [Salvia miltiorrhiza]